MNVSIGGLFGHMVSFQLDESLKVEWLNRMVDVKLFKKLPNYVQNSCTILYIYQ